ncbi:nucleoporin NUP35-like [Rhopilema esculentum]|uniref:nucleoporin NUP35-like n=1 Tax=Rhopilema esculentum TaxID=499914 RepID=UPI0031CE85FF
MLSDTAFTNQAQSQDGIFSPKTSLIPGSFHESAFSGQSGGNVMMSTSPDHPPHSISKSGSSTYLPNYLLGATSSPTTTPQFGRSLSNVGQGSSPHIHGLSRASSQQVQMSDSRNQQKRISPLLQQNIRDKQSNAPPVGGLYDDDRCMTVDEIYSAENWTGCTPSRSFMSPNSVSRSLATPGSAKNIETPMHSSVYSPRIDGVIQSPAQVDPFYTQGERLTTNDMLDERWVTVFGFPFSMVGYILEQFSQYGLIEKKEIKSNVNWVHIQYQSKLQAKKALSKNGKILNGNIMIGVCQCINKDVMESSEDSAMNRSVFHTPAKDAAQQMVTPKQSSLRPLTAAYNAAANQNKVVQEGKGTPQRTNSIVSRAMEYVFGL